MSGGKLGWRYIPVVEGGCDMCPNDMVEVFWEGRSCRTFCPSCGNSTRTDYPTKQRPPRASKKKAPTVKDTPRVAHDDDERQKEWERVQWIKEQQKKQRSG